MPDPMSPIDGESADASRGAAHGGLDEPHQSPRAEGNGPGTKGLAPLHHRPGIEEPRLRGPGSQVNVSKGRT